MGTFDLNTKSTGLEVGSKFGVPKVWSHTELGQSSEKGQFHVSMPGIRERMSRVVDANVCPTPLNSPHNPNRRAP